MNRDVIQLITVALLLWHSGAQAQLTIAQGRQIDSIFHDWDAPLPGGVVAVVQKGQVIYKKAFGLADIRKKIPNDPSLRFDLASTSKQFTAMCIALLEEQGKLSFDDDLKKYYPELKIKEPVKIKHLIHHTSGIRDAAVLAVLSGKMNLKGDVREKYNTVGYYLECLMRETDLNHPPGQQFIYNNFNYILLGDIVHSVSGKTLSEFSDSAIFKPLGMTRTQWRDNQRMQIEQSAKGYLFQKGKFKQRNGKGGIVGDHNLFSTVDDLVRWQNNFRNNKLGKGKPQLIERFCDSTTFNNGTRNSYGFGVWTGRYKGVYEIGHGGDDGRHVSTLKWFPEHDLSIIVLANSSRFDDMQEKAYSIVNTLLAEFIIPHQENNEKYTTTSLPADQLKKRAGVYTLFDENGLGQLVRIQFDKDKLYVSRHYSFKGHELSAVDSSCFIAHNFEGEMIKIQFSEEQGRIVLKETFRNSTRHYIRRVDEPISFSDFKGRFENKSTGASIFVKEGKGKISARKGIFRICLIPFAKDQFYAPDNQALFVFRRNSAGQITGFLAHAYDFRNFNFEKVK
jgi:CubicO group peptidase (beta-lactamase class C family)